MSPERFQDGDAASLGLVFAWSDAGSGWHLGLWFGEVAEEGSFLRKPEREIEIDIHAGEAERLTSGAGGPQVNRAELERGAVLDEPGEVIGEEFLRGFGGGRGMGEWLWSDGGLVLTQHPRLRLVFAKCFRSPSFVVGQ